MAGGNVILPSGTVVAHRYRIAHLIGEGGMSAVYEVTHLTTGQRMALKTMRDSLSASSDAIQRFLAESKMTAATRSEHIVKVIDADTDGELGIPFFVMELLEGENLQFMLKRVGPLGPDAVVGLLRQAGLALDRTHAVGLVHRDLKPENLFRTTRDDGSDCLKILDFGIAKVVDLRSQAEVTRNVGTPLYMSPEQYDGDPNIDQRTDLYSLGHIAFTLLVGHAYWEPEAEQLGRLVRSVLQGAPEAARIRARRWGVELPAAFDAWFAKATAKTASDRFDTAAEFVEELAAALAVELPTVVSLSRHASFAVRGEKSPRPVMFSPSPASGSPVRARLGKVGAGAVALIGLAVFYFLKPEDDAARSRRGSTAHAFPLPTSTSAPAAAPAEIATFPRAPHVPIEAPVPTMTVPSPRDAPSSVPPLAPASRVVISGEARRTLEVKGPKKPAVSNAAPSASMEVVW